MKVISTSENKWGQIVLFAVMCVIFHATAPGKPLLIMSFLVVGLEEKLNEGNGPRVSWTCFVLLFRKEEKSKTVDCIFPQALCLSFAHLNPNSPSKQD